jgi:uncharacterized protein
MNVLSVLRNPWRLLAACCAIGMLPTMGVAQAVSGAVDARTIRVSGVGEVRAEPDLATVHFAVETTGSAAQQAAQQNAESMDRVIRALVAAGVPREDISTTGYSLYPEYAPQPRGAEMEPPRIRGYRASNQVGVRTTRLDRVGQLIDAGLAAGANRLSGVGFELLDPRPAQAQALERAVENARHSAETIARALGVRLGVVLDASTSAEPVRPVFRAAREMSMDAIVVAPPTPIEPGQQTVRAMASVVFAIE